MKRFFSVELVYTVTYTFIRVHTRRVQYRYQLCTTHYKFKRILFVAPQPFAPQMPPPPPAGYPAFASLPPTSSFVGTSGATFLPPPPPSLAGLSGMPPTSAFAQLNLSGPAPWLTGGAPSGVGQLPPPPRMLFSYTTSGLSAPYSGATYAMAGPTSLPPPPMAPAMGKPGGAALSTALPPPPPPAAASTS